MSALRVNVSDLLQRPQSRRALVVDETLEGLRTTTAEVSATSPIHLDIVLERIPDGIVIRGRVQAHYRAECRLGPRIVERDLDLPVSELFEPSPIEGETYPIEGFELDLEQVVRDTLLVELPLVTVCDDATENGCAECADDLALARTNEPDPRWAALNALLPESSAMPRSN
jgi:uncharacterized protein